MLEVGERNDDWGSTRTGRRYLVLVQRGLPALQQAQRSATSQVHNSRTSPDCGFQTASAGLPPHLISSRNVAQPSPTEIATPPLCRAWVVVAQMRWTTWYRH
jgi:hypothetical protein